MRRIAGGRSLAWLIGGGLPAAVLAAVAVPLGAQTDFQPVQDSILPVVGDDVRSRVLWDMSFSAYTTKHFRGVIPSAGLTVAGQGGFIHRGFYVGMFGGVGLSPKTDVQPGIYQETDLFVGYVSPRFSASLQWYQNFTEGITDIPEPSGFFDFGTDTRGLLDLLFSYRFGSELQWQIHSSTFLPPTRDRDLLPGPDGSPVRGDPRYTQYLEFQRSGRWGANAWRVRVGGSWRWTSPPDGQPRSTFYDEREGIHNIGFDYIRYIRLGEGDDVPQLPVKVLVVINPLADRAYFIVGVDLIQLAS